jgi:ketosteroid isomerase-like protein
MSSLARPDAQQNGTPENGHPESPNVQAIREAFRASVEEGFEAGLESLLRHAREDCEVRPYIGSGRVLRGHDEIRTYYRDVIAGGTTIRLKPTSFHERGDDVVVDGSIRVARASGGFSESQISWTYRFHDGLLTSARWGPRRAS